ncbi:MAG: hypothetical protein N2440_02115 [Actinobacteria bacterium]|nr:hypothetical protein [Actinomycetota bacterium]
MFKLKRFEEKYRAFVEEHSLYACVSLLDDDFNNMFVILRDDDEYVGFGFVRINENYAELNGPFIRNFVSEKDFKNIVRKVIEGIKRYYPEMAVYFFTDYPEYFENLGCEIAFNAPSEVLLKAVPG